MLFSVTDLIYFTEVATELHFSRAAKKLHVSQPSLSLAINRLEKALTIELFIRHKRGVTLTRAGSQLFKDVKKLLTQWDEIITNVKAVNQTVKGKVTIGCHSTITHFMTGMISQLLITNPALEIHFHHALTPEIMENILQGHLDIGIVTDPYPNQDVILQKIAVTEFTFWRSTQHTNTYDLYDEDAVIICDPQLAPTQFLLKELQKVRNNKRLRLSTINDIETIVTMTAENCGIGILPTAWTELNFKHKLDKIPNSPLYRKPLCLAYRSENKNIKSVQIVLDAIKTVAKK